MTLNDIMEFDQVIRVHEDGTITNEDGVYAPSLYEGELDSPGWKLLDGYSAQDHYSGPIMHDSEFIGGPMEDDIRSTPGVYVAIVSYYFPEKPDEDLGVEGWAVARQIETPQREDNPT